MTLTSLADRRRRVQDEARALARRMPPLTREEIEAQLAALAAREAAAATPHGWLRPQYEEAFRHAAWIAAGLATADMLDHSP